jgi:hypothetical protein
MIKVFLNPELKHGVIHYFIQSHIYKAFIPTGLNMPNLSQIYNIERSYYKDYVHAKLGFFNAK